MSPSTFSDAKHHLVYRIMNARVSGYPFSHMLIENALPEDFYRQMIGNRPGDDKFMPLVDTGRVGPQYSRARQVLFQTTCESAQTSDLQFWAGALGAFNSPDVKAALLTRFMPDIVAFHNQDVAAITAKPMRREAFLMRDGAGYGLKPHSDQPHKVISALFYMPPDDKWAHLGTSLYVPKDRDFRDTGEYAFHPRENFDRVVTLPYKPNTFVAFAKTDRSYHGVETVEKGERDLLLFDIKMPLPSEVPDEARAA